MHTITIGQQADEYIIENKLDRKKISNIQPAGLNFYHSKWQADKCQTIKVKNGKKSIQIPFCLSMVATENADDQASGLYSVRINAQISANEFITHQHALTHVMETLKNLTRNNWHSFIDFSHPRLTGSDAARYYQESGGEISFPADYQISLDQWMHQDIPEWTLFNDTGFLTLSVIRDTNNVSMDTHGDYLLSYLFQSNKKTILSYFEHEEKEKWVMLWKDTIEKLKKERKEKENKLITQGYEINYNYVDLAPSQSDLNGYE